MGHIYTKLNLDSCDLLKHYFNTNERKFGVSQGLWRWVENSCIKTKSGDDLICYHGSPSKDSFAVFNDSSGYGCKSFIGFFSLNRDFAECYTSNTSDFNSGCGKVRSFAINSKNLFDIKNPACQRFLKTHLPNTINCNGDILDRDSFINYLKTEKLLVNNYKLTINDFANLKMFEQISSKILSDSAWEYSCSLAQDKKLHNRPFLGIDQKSNSVFVLDYYNTIRPDYRTWDFKKYMNKLVDGIRLSFLKVPFDKAIELGILTSAHIASLAQGKPVNVKLSAEEFINACSMDSDIHKEELTDLERQKLRNMLNNPDHANLDFSVDVILEPKKIDLNEFSQGLAGGYTLDNTGETWRIYENSYCIVDDQEVHILDWLKNEGFDAVVVKEDWAVNIICLYKNMIKAITNQMPSESDNVYETYDYSDALLADLF